MGNATQDLTRRSSACSSHMLRRSARLQIIEDVTDVPTTTKENYSHMEVEPTNKVIKVVSSSPSDVTLLVDVDGGKGSTNRNNSSSYFSQETTVGRRYSVVESSWSERGSSSATTLPPPSSSSSSSTASTHRRRKRLANIQNKQTSSESDNHVPPHNKRALEKGDTSSNKKRSRRRSPRLHNNNNNENSVDTTVVTRKTSSTHDHSIKQTAMTPELSTPTTTCTSSTCTKSKQQTKDHKNVQKDRRPFRILPQGVVDLYPSSLRPHRNCDCELNHCTGTSLSESFLATYGSEYSENLKLAEQQQQCCNTVVVPSYTNNHIYPDMEYMSRQPHLTPKMRAILMDWLIELAEEYKLHSTTLHLAATLVDQVLALKSKESNGNNKGESDFIVKREQLQCLGCSCMWIACKMEEIEPMSVDDFVYISDSSYNREEIAKMELSVCMSLQFHLQHITPISFLHEFLRASQEESHMNVGCTNGGSVSSSSSSLCCMARIQHSVLEHMVLYLLELTLLPYELVTHKPSLVTAAAVYLARATLGLRDAKGRIWSKSLQHYTGYDLIDLEETVLCLHKYQCEAEEAELKSVFIKYGTPKYNRVSLKTALPSTDLGF